MAPLVEAAAQEQVRGWSLDGALMLEVIEAGQAPLFLVKAGGSWTWCAGLEAAQTLLWQERRTRAALPAQWAPPAPEVMDEFHQNWEQLRKLQAGQWWPELSATRRNAGPDGDATLD